MTGRTHWKYCAGMLVCRMQEMQLVKRQHLVLGPRSGQKNTLPESEVHCLKSVGDHTEAPLDGRTDGCHSVVELGFRSMGCRVDEGSKQLLHQRVNGVAKQPEHVPENNELRKLGDYARVGEHFAIRVSTFPRPKAAKDKATR